MALTGDRPVFIVGYERSGTTLLMMLLGNHPRLAFPEVGWLYPRIYPWRHTYGDLSVDANFRTLCSEMLFGLNKPFWGMPLNPSTAVEDICAQAPERSFTGIYAAMHRRFLAQFPGKTRWGQKTPKQPLFRPPDPRVLPGRAVPVHHARRAGRLGHQPGIGIRRGTHLHGRPDMGRRPALHGAFPRNLWQRHVA